MLASVGAKALGEVTCFFQIPATVFQVETIYEKEPDGHDLDKIALRTYRLV